MKLNFGFMIKFLILVTLLAFLGSWIASYSYEPLDKVAEELNLKENELFKAPLSGYTLGVGTVNFLGHDLDISGIFAGLIGTLITFTLAYLISVILKRR